MGFFKNLKEDFSKAVNELLPDENFEDETVKELSEPGLEQEKDLSETMKEKPETELIEEILLKDNLRDNKHKAEEETMAKFKNKSTVTERESLYDDDVDKDLVAEMFPEDEEESLADEIVAEGTITNLAGDNVTVIAKGTKIIGSVISETSLQVNGIVIGDVECLGTLSVNGLIEGNSIAADIYATKSRIEGNLTSKGTVNLSEGTVVIGNVEASSAVIAGGVKGQMNVNGPVILDSTAIVKGDIKAKSVQINNGAVIDGRWTLSYATVDIDSFFDK